MGNACNCNGPQQECLDHEVQGDDITPRLMLRPEKLPQLTNAVKAQGRRVNNERGIEVAAFNNNNKQENRFPRKKPDLETNLNVVVKQQEQLKQAEQQMEEVKMELGMKDQKQNNLSQPNQQRSKTSMSKNEDQPKEPSKPQTLYEKLGGEDGVRIFSEKTLDKALQDPQLNQFFKTVNMELLKEKFRLFITYLVGASPYWIGKSMQEAHKTVLITDQLFDQFVSLCVASLKEMRVKHDCLKETVRTLQSLRDSLVKKPEELEKKNLFEEIGGMETLKQVCEITMKKVALCPTLSPFFQYADNHLHERRFAYYLQYATGGSDEWIGKSIMQAHKGKLIQEDHLDKFLQYLRASLIEVNISKNNADKIIQNLNVLKADIVEDRAQLTLFEKLDTNNKFEPIMTSFIDKMMKDKILGPYFSNNKMKHCISNKIVLFFAYNKGILNPDDMQTLKDYHKVLKLNIFDFERSIVLFKEALYENNIDPFLVEETLNFYKVMRKDLIWNGEEEIKNEDKKINIKNLAQTENIPALQERRQNLLNPGGQCPFYQDKINIKKDSSKVISSFKLESDLQINPHINIDSQNDGDISHEQEEQQKNRELQEQKSKQEEEERKLKEQKEEEEREKQKEEQLRKQQQEKDQKLAQEFKQIQIEEPIEAKDDEVVKQEVDQQIQQYEYSLMESRQQSPQKMKKQTYKYYFQDLMNDPTIYEGQLNRFMDKQKTQLPRWLILKQQTLLIYKDQLSSKSFPLKPLYCIPLQEIKMINQSENLLYPNQRKSQAIHSIQIDLKECYGLIASSVAQLLTGNTVLMGAGQQQQGKGNQKNLQSHGYNDTSLIFVCQSKKDILSWVKKLKQVVSFEDKVPEVVKSLYERLGGAEAINAVVEGMYVKIFNDPDLKDFFKKTDKEHQKEMQRQFLTFATGGTKEWAGKSMYEAHKGRGIGKVEFDKVAAHVISTLQDLSVPENLVNEVTQLLLSLQTEVTDEEQKEPLQSSQGQQQQLKKTIFDKIGGEAAISALVDGMYVKIFNDPELKEFFKKTNQDHQKEMQRQFLTYATGGFSEWKGKSMYEAHKGRGIKSYEFDKVALHIVKTLQELNVSQEHINDIVSLLLPMKKQILEDQSQYPSFVKQKQSLFERLGGSASINKLVNGMYDKIFNDPDLKEYFYKTDKNHQKEMQRQFLTHVTGGSEEWNGKSMGEAHRGRGIGKQEFDKTVEHIVKTLIEMEVQQDLIDEVKSLLDTLKAEIGTYEQTIQ